MPRFCRNVNEPLLFNLDLTDDEISKINDVVFDYNFYIMKQVDQIENLMLLICGTVDNFVLFASSRFITINAICVVY